MSIVIREQDILKKEPPHTVGFWDEQSIRSYQESYGINYGQAVFERGVKPNREWSNDRTFNGVSNKELLENAENQLYMAEEVKKDGVDVSEEISELKATIQSLQDMVKSLANTQPKDPVSPTHMTGVDRHGLKPEHLDKRTREYKESVGK